MSDERIQQILSQVTSQDEILQDEDEVIARRKRLLEFLSRTEPAWKDEDHPDIVALGTAGWVRALRDEKSERQRRIDEKFAEE